MKDVVVIGGGAAGGKLLERLAYAIGPLPRGVR